MEFCGGETFKGEKKPDQCTRSPPPWVFHPPCLTNAIVQLTSNQEFPFFIYTTQTNKNTHNKINISHVGLESLTCTGIKNDLYLPLANML